MDGAKRRAVMLTIVTERERALARMMLAFRATNARGSPMKFGATARVFGCAALIALLASCASSYVLVGTRRPAISPDQVRVLLQPPAHYETVALLESSDMAGRLCFSAQCKTDKVMSRLKDEAAKLGANAILLQGLGSQYAGSVGTGFGSASYGHGYAYGSGVGVSSAIMSEHGKAVAIYIP